MLNFAVLILALACTTIWVRPFERRSDEFTGKPFDDDPDSDKYPKFKPFVCNDKQMQEWLNATQLKYFTLNEGDLYFYYGPFVIKHQIPEFYRSFGDDESDYESYNLVHPEPVYSDYYSMLTPPTILQVDDITTIIQEIWTSEKLTYVLRESYYWLRDGRHFLRLAYELRYIKIIIGELGESFPSLARWTHKKEMVIGFIRYDYSKWFEVSYDQNGTQIFFELFEGNYYKGEVRRNQDYKVSHMIYHEPVEGGTNIFAGLMIEVDNSTSNIHISNYVFVHTEPTGLQIHTRDHQDMSLLEFFGCIQAIKYPHQFKGIWVNQTTTTSSHHRSYLFVNSFYLVLNYDLVDMNFVLFDEDVWDQSARRINFKDPNENPKRERIASKHVKHIEAGQVYLTLNSEQSHEIEFEEVKPPAEPEEQVLASPSKLLPHTCKHSTITITNFSFCFDTKSYYLKSEDGFQSVLTFQRKHTYSQLFNGSDIIYDDEKFEYAMNYGPTKVVFVTLHYLLIIDKSLLHIKKEIPGGALRLKLTQKHQLTPDQYTRKPNCLFVQCSVSLADLDRIEGDRTFELSEILRPKDYPLKSETGKLADDQLALTRLTHDEVSTLAKGSITKRFMIDLYHKYMKKKG